MLAGGDDVWASEPEDGTRHDTAGGVIGLEKLASAEKGSSRLAQVLDGVRFRNDCGG